MVKSNLKRRTRKTTASHFFAERLEDRTLFNVIAVIFTSGGVVQDPSGTSETTFVGVQGMASGK